MPATAPKQNGVLLNEVVSEGLKKAHSWGHMPSRALGRATLGGAGRVPSLVTLSSFGSPASVLEA